MAAIAFCNHPNLEAYDILAQNAKADLTLRTPIFSMHVLHFATARLEVPPLQHIINNPNTPLEAAGTTALGHTLLHISTLPLTDAHVNILAKKISTASTTCAPSTPNAGLPSISTRVTPLAAVFSPLRLASTRFRFLGPLRTRTIRAGLQEEMVLWLLGTGTQDVGTGCVWKYTAALPYFRHVGE
jgi:hypothetical protein